jgi:putative endonuclease
MTSVVSEFLLLENKGPNKGGTMKPGFVYILASKRNGTLYVGVTSDLVARIHQHKKGAIPGFTRKYDVKRLVWFETHEDIEEALIRERRIKNWRRKWKLQLIEKDNPYWRDLFFEICGVEEISGSPLPRG